MRLRYALIGLLLLGCQRSADPGDVTANDVKRQVSEAVDTTGKFLDRDHGEAQRRLEATTRDLGKSVEVWKEKLRNATDEERPALEAKVRDLERRYDAVKEQVVEFGRSHEDTWESVRDRVDHSLNDLKNALDQ